MGGLKGQSQTPTAWIATSPSSEISAFSPEAKMLAPAASALGASEPVAWASGMWADWTAQAKPRDGVPVIC